MPSTGGNMLAAYFPLIILFVFMYLMLIRPQQQQARRRKEMLAALKKGDKVLTAGGIYGTIVDVKDDVVELRIADKVEVRVAKGGVTNIIK